MRKVIIVIALAALLSVLLLTGCGQRAQRQYDGRMKTVGAGVMWEILVDTETGVCYLRTSKGGPCVMVNQDGTPYIANGWRDYGE